MIAIVLGLLAASMLATSTLCSSRSVHMIGQYSVVAWAMLVGLVVSLPVALSGGVPAGVSGINLAWMALAGCSNVLGMVLAFAALKYGKVSVVAPVLATAGAIAATISALLGEPLEPTVMATLLVVVVGVVLSSVAPDPAPLEHEEPLRSVLLAVSAASLFGLTLFSTGHLSGDMPVVWALLPPRVVGVLVLTIPIAASRRLRLTRAAVPLVIATGLAEVLGFAAFSAAARDSVAIASVLVSQFATISVIVAFVLFRERLGRLQVAGALLLVVGVTALSIVSA